jgi:cytochrome c oxidase subunit IV
MHEQAATTEQTGHAEAHTEHIVPPWLYGVIITTLLILTLATVGAALIDLGKFNIVVALVIATTKATLVVLFFMHAKYIPKRTQLVIIAGIFWLAILLFMTMSDYVSRIDYRGVRFPMSQNAQVNPLPRG